MLYQSKPNTWLQFSSHEMLRKFHIIWLVGLPAIYDHQLWTGARQMTYHTHLYIPLLQDTAQFYIALTTPTFKSPCSKILMIDHTHL